MSNPGASGTERNLIVVVDDDEAVRDSLRFSFVIEGFAVRAFSSGQQLLAEMSLPAGDCFVVDQNMPGMSGLDLISNLRARNLTAPAILITSHPNCSGTRARCCGWRLHSRETASGFRTHGQRAPVPGAAIGAAHQTPVKISQPRREPMIRDILVNLDTNSAQDAARDYAISVASMFEAHLTGVAFAYEPVNPGTLFDGIGTAIIAQYRDELRTAAQTARRPVCQCRTGGRPAVASARPRTRPRRRRHDVRQDGAKP